MLNMTTLGSTKVRLVRCPRCHKVLAELPEVSLYMCGGCGTILQAKNRKVETNNIELSSQEPDSVVESQQDNLLGRNEARNSNQDLSGSPKVESSPDKDNWRCQDEQDDSVDLCEDRIVSDGGLSSSPDFTCPPSEDSPVEVKESLVCNPLGQSPNRYQSQLHDDKWDGTAAGSDFSNELSSSGEITLEDEAYTPRVSEHVEQQNQRDLHEDNSVNQKEDGEYQSVRQDDDNLVDEVQNLPEHEDQKCVLSQGIKDNYVPSVNDEKSQIFSADQNGGINHTGLDSPSGTISHENNIVSPLAEQVDEGSEDLPLSRSSSTEKSMAPSCSDSILASQSSPLNESLVSFYLMSDEEHLDHSRREITCNFERVSSADTLGSSNLADLTSERNFRYGSMTNYPTNVSCDAYDGSESSYDGTDYHVREHSHSSRKNKNMDHIRTSEFFRKDGFLGNNVVSNGTERTYWATSSSHCAMKRSDRNRGKSTETNRYTDGSTMRVGIQGDVSGLPFTSGDPVAGNRTASTSSYCRNLLPPRPGLNSPNKPSNLEPGKIELLRTVCELKDQLNRIHFPKATSNIRFPDGRFSHFHYDHFAPDEEIYADLNHPGGYNSRHNHAKGCAERCNVSRLAFSGEAAHYRHQVSCSCLHRCPQDWHYSAQLPPRPVHCKDGHHVFHTDRNCCNIFSSLSPHHYTSADLSLRGCESDNQRLDEIKRLHLKEKYHKVKRHLRPIAGGAPFVACYHCSELLQLPADFLLFKKRYHQLMCNACRKILKFSLVKRTHIVPYIPGASAPPPSEADDYNGATRQRSQPGSCQHVEPASYSDDYGRSFCRSCSTEGEGSVMLRGEMNSYNRKISSVGSHEPMEDRKMEGILKEPQNKPFSKMPKWRNRTSEIEEVPPSSNSPLHRLMGYSSPSKVLNR